jgi:hypothetical protein
MLSLLVKVVTSPDLNIKTQTYTMMLALGASMTSGNCSVRVKIPASKLIAL